MLHRVRPGPLLSGAVWYLEDRYRGLADGHRVSTDGIAAVAGAGPCADRFGGGLGEQCAAKGGEPRDGGEVIAHPQGQLE